MSGPTTTGTASASEAVNAWHNRPHGPVRLDGTRAREQADLPTLLAAIDNALRNGSYMTGANCAFEELCDLLNVDRDSLTFRPDWTDGGRP